MTFIFESEQSFPNVARRYSLNILLAIFFFVAVEAIFCIIKLNIQAVFPQKDFLSSVIGIIGVIGLIFITLRYPSEIQILFNKIAEKLSTYGIAFPIIVGLLLRVIWVVLFPAPPTSDSITYYDLAQKLMTGKPYMDTGGHYAFWPPGYPIFLSVFFTLFGASTHLITALNLLLFLMTSIIIRRLVLLISNDKLSVCSLFITSVYPGYLTLIGIASKEILLIFILSSAVLAYLYAVRSKLLSETVIYASVMGGLLGFGSLTQPSLLLLPGVFVFHILITGNNLLKKASVLSIALLLMIITILPWTFRNYAIFHKWVLITSNGGSVFYRANNPLANGGYTDRGETDLSNFNELEQSRHGYRLGMEWIRNNPDRFLKLAFRKQSLFLGDDAAGVYETLKRGRGEDGKTYVLLKGLSNMFWLAVWIFIIFGIKEIYHCCEEKKAKIILPILCILYLYLIHSIFESSGKYHLPLTGLFTVLGAMALNSENKGETLLCRQKQ